MRKVIAFLIAVCLGVTGSFAIALAADVTPSREEYELSFKGFDVFFGNATPAKPGTEVYLTYTVDEIRSDNKSTQNGVIATDQPEAEYPYLEGGVLISSNTAPLLEKGCRYFFKFVYTEEGGFEYIAAKANGRDSKYIVFDFNTSNSPDYPFTDKSTHFGVWFGGIVSVKLKHVRCYDKSGNDLGVLAPKHHESLLDEVSGLDNAKDLNHSYSVKVTDGMNVAISNGQPTDADTVYMEYTVKSCASKIYQYGLINHTDPGQEYPFAKHGSLLVESMYEGGKVVTGPGFLLQEGASYIIRFERKSQYFIGLIQKTYQGKTELKEITTTYGNYISGAEYFALWFGEGKDCPINFELVDFKCYDGKKNNLGVQANHTASQNKPVEIVHYGEIEDYTGCEALYYSKESGAVIALYADKTAKVTRDAKTENIRYIVEDDKLILEFGNKTETYEYYYQKFKDSEGRTYVRLHKYYVTFMTGTDEKIARQTIDAKCGYRAERPETPVKEDAEFLGWCHADGTEFDFDSIVDESVTLYAKWSDLPVYEAVQGASRIFSPQGIAITVSAVLLASGIAGGVIVWRKGKKDESQKKKANQ